MAAILAWGSELGLRTAAVVILAVAYYLLWRPARAFFVQGIAHPFLSWIYQGTGVELSGGGDAVVLRAAGDVGQAHLRAPAGITFVLPALVLIALFPRKPYWLYFLGLHIIIGLLEWTFALTGMHHWNGATHFADFLVEYAVPAIGIGVPIMLWSSERKTFSLAATLQNRISGNCNNPKEIPERDEHVRG